jgi:anti-anti-sigma factor
MNPDTASLRSRELWLAINCATWAQGLAHPFRGPARRGRRPRREEACECRGPGNLYAARTLAPELIEAAGAAYPRLIVDLSRVTFVDSSGFGAILEAHQRLQRQGRDVKVVAPAGSAAAVLIDLAGLRSSLVVRVAAGGNGLRRVVAGRRARAGSALRTPAACRRGVAFATPRGTGRVDDIRVPH